MLPFEPKDKKGGIAVIISKMMKGQGTPEQEQEKDPSVDYELAMEKAMEGLIEAIGSADTQSALAAFKDLSDMCSMEKEMEQERPKEDYSDS